MTVNCINNSIILGGWLLFGNLTFEDSSLATELYDTVVNGDCQISSLSEAPGGRFLLISALFGTLSEYTGFKEVRVRCFKPWHGRTAHFVMKGEYLKKTLFQSAHTVGICGHDAIRFLPDDNSVSRSVACNNLKSGYGGWPNIYNHLLYSPNILISLIKDRFDVMMFTVKAVSNKLARGNFTSDEEIRSKNRRINKVFYSGSFSFISTELFS